MSWLAIQDCLCWVPASGSGFAAPGTRDVQGLTISSYYCATLRTNRDGKDGANAMPGQGTRDCGGCRLFVPAARRTTRAR